MTDWKALDARLHDAGRFQGGGPDPLVDMSKKMLPYHSCSASQPGRRARSRPHRTTRRRQVRLAPRFGSPQAVCLRSCGCLLRSHPPHRSVPAPVARAPYAVTARAPQAPFRVLLRGEREEREEQNHPCTSTSDFAHSFENLSITSQRFARSVAPCSKASHAEKSARRPRCGKLPHAARIMDARGEKNSATMRWPKRAPASYGAARATSPSKGPR